MGKILYIKASPRGERSFSSAVAEAFLGAHLRSHPDATVETLDLFEETIPSFDFEAASAKYKIMHGKEHSEQDKRVWERIVAVIERFKAADKYVIAVPMWNFSIPYRLKQYIDVIVQPGLTFGVTEDGGYEGLVGDKPTLVVYSRGGEYPASSPQEAFDMQKKYVELILGFMGITSVRSVVIEPTLAAGPEVAEQKKTKAIEQAKALAADF